MAATASAQHGLISGPQLAAAGISRRQRQSAVRSARLHRHGAVYWVGCRRPTRDARLMAAVLTAGVDCVLAGRPSLARWGLLQGSGPVELLAPTQRRSRRDVRIARRPFDPRRDVRRKDGLPLLAPLAALVDAAGGLTADQIQVVVDELNTRRWLHPKAVAELLARSRGRPGAARIRAALGALDPSRGRPKQALERAFAAFARHHGLPAAVRGDLVDIGDGELLELREMDVWFPAARLIVELDGGAFHATARQQARDARRDRRLLAAGVRTLRVTWTDLDAHEQELADDLHALLAR